jgi:integrase/recombinase XerC
MLQKFLDYLQYEKRFSHHTIKSYGIDLDQAHVYLDGQYETTLIEATFEMLRSWLVTLVDDGLTAKTINRKASSLKSFYKWARRYHGLQTDPTAKIQVPKIPKRLPVYVEKEQMSIIKSENSFPNSPEGKRDQLIIELFYQTGIRSAELIDLKIKNVDAKSGTIKVFGKRNKERIIPVGNDLLTMINAYLVVRDKWIAEDSNPYLFLTTRGSKLYPKLVYKVVNTYLGAISSLKKKSPHVLRHTFATHMLNQGGDLNAIKELLGHASLAATQVYTHNSIEKLKDIHSKAHPNG